MKLTETGWLQSDQLIKALCSTLLHSLWQGIALAVIAGLIMVFTKNVSAAMRYNLLVGALTLFAVGATATFIYEVQKPAGWNSPATVYITDHNAGKAITTSNEVPAARLVTAPPVSVKPITSQVQPPANENITQTVTTYLNTHYNAIVLIWFLIICAKSVQMAVGLQGVYHLKKTSVYAVSKTWEGKFLQLAKQLHIRQSIRILESGIARVPMVIGHLKPVILIPIGLINALSVEEVEAILVHELAHIRRRDYLINFLQGFMEIVFFFNPAVLWVSKLIKAERENCCDDLVLAQNNNKVSYIRALLSCEEYQSSVPTYAMGFPGGKNMSLQRVKRMIS
ncbi:MAG TPA: M56 family metallopeptidase, partial [Mucilaginibacter sp.]